MVNPEKTFHSNSVGSPSILSKFLWLWEEVNPYCYLLPCFVEIRILLYLTKKQYIIRKDVHFRVLKIDVFFVPNEREIFPWMFFPTNRIQTWDLILFCQLNSQICGTFASVWDLQYSMEFWLFHRLIGDSRKTYRDTTHNLKRVDFCALEIDNSFITYQRLTFPMNGLSQPIFHSRDLMLFRDSFEDVEHLFECEVFCIRDGMTIVQVILSHEYCWFHCYRHEHSHISKNVLLHLLQHWKFTLSFTRFTNDLDSTDNSNSVSWLPHDGIFTSCHFLRIQIIKSPWSIMKCSSVPCGLRGSVEKDCFVMRTNLLHRIPRSFIRFSLIDRASWPKLSTLEKTKHGSSSNFE